MSCKEDILFYLNFCSADVDSHTWEKLLEVGDNADKKINHLQYKIDELMLEHCPDDMTDEQLEIWAENQVPA